VERPLSVLTDRHGLGLSTNSQRAADHYVRGLDLQLSLNAGGVEGLTAAVEVDPAFAMGHAALAFAQWYRSGLPAATISMQHARDLAAGTLPREQRHIEIVGAFLDGEALRVLSLVKEHLAETPLDGLMVHLGSMTITGSGRLGRRDEAYGLLAPLAPAWGEDWWFLGIYAFAHHEMDQLDQSRRLAERSLALQPRNASGAHPLSHVYFESNDHAGGASFLRDWITEYDRAAPFFCHLSWHLALFELARGNTDRVLELYESTISPSVGQARTTLVDSASMLWRYQIYGCQPEVDLPWGRCLLLRRESRPEAGHGVPGCPRRARLCRDGRR